MPVYFVVVIFSKSLCYQVSVFSLYVLRYSAALSVSFTDFLSVTPQYSEVCDIIVPIDV